MRGLAYQHAGGAKQSKSMRGWAWPLSGDVSESLAGEEVHSEAVVEAEPDLDPCSAFAWDDTCWKRAFASITELQ
jgi:hypothetical protein